MKKTFVILSAAILLIAILWMSLKIMNSTNIEQASQQTSKQNPEMKSEEKSSDKTSIFGVDEVAQNPEEFKGIIGIEGSVNNVDKKNSTFSLGCEDACIILPVKYSGNLPSEGSNIITYGEISRNENNKFIFIAQGITEK